MRTQTSVGQGGVLIGVPDSSDDECMMDGSACSHWERESCAFGDDGVGGGLLNSSTIDGVGDRSCMCYTIDAAG